MNPDSDFISAIAAPHYSQNNSDSSVRWTARIWLERALEVLADSDLGPEVLLAPDDLRACQGTCRKLFHKYDVFPADGEEGPNMCATCQREYLASDNASMTEPVPPVGPAGKCPEDGAERDGCCSCHSNPPCGFCVSPENCPERDDRSHCGHWWIGETCCDCEAKFTDEGQ